MRVLVACEFSGIVRSAFEREGHDAWSCDLLPTEIPGNHIVGDVRLEIGSGWDLMVAHPPCTYLARSGARWWSRLKDGEQTAALNFIRILLGAPIPRIALENPIGAISTHIRPPDQVVQPWMFGHPETKASCLWIKGLPLLKPTQIIQERFPRSHFSPDSKDRWKRRSRTLSGIAEAMARQWGSTDR